MAALPPLFVVDRVPGRPAGKPVLLCEFIGTCRGVPKLRPEEGDPKGYYGRKVVWDQRAMALDEVCRDIRERPLSAKAIRHLFDEDIGHIRTYGDAYLWQLVEKKEQEKKKEREEEKEKKRRQQEAKTPFLPLEVLAPQIPWPDGYTPQRERERGWER